MEERIMDKVTIVFWSQSGNTESMANAVAEGVTAAGKEAVVVDVASASLDDLKAAKGFAMGCPAMGAEVLEVWGIREIIFYARIGIPTIWKNWTIMEYMNICMP